MRSRFSSTNQFKNFGLSTYAKKRSEESNRLLAGSAEKAEALGRNHAYSNPSYALEIIAGALLLIKLKQLDMAGHREALRRAGEYALDRLCEKGGSENGY